MNFVKHAFYHHVYHRSLRFISHKALKAFKMTPEKLPANDFKNS